MCSDGSGSDIEVGRGFVFYHRQKELETQSPIPVAADLRDSDGVFIFQSLDS